MSIILKNKETLQYKNFYFKCCIGKRGLTSNKKEGDQKTPKGEFGIEKLYGVPTVLVSDQDEDVLNSPFIEDWTTARTKKPEDLTDFLSRWIEG